MTFVASNLYGRMDKFEKLIKIIENSSKRRYVVTAYFKRRIYEYIGDVAVGSEDSGDEAEERLRVGYIVIVSVNKSCLICYLVLQLITLFNAHYRALGSFCRAVGKFDKGLGFARAFCTDEKFNHFKSPPVF